MTERFIEMVLSNAAGALVLAAVAVLAGRFLRRPEVVHALWLLVLLRLLIPPVFELVVPVLPAPEPLTKAAPASSSSSKASSVEATPPPSISPVVVAVAVVWLTGTFLVLGLAVVRTARFRRSLTAGGPAPGGFEERLTALAERMGVGRAPQAVMVDGAVSPMLWATFGSRQLVVPSALVERLSAAEQDALVAHELAHLRRRDHWVRYLELAAVAFYWWHPASWWARRQLRRAEERCCDVLVTRTLPEGRRAYAECLLKTVKYLAGSRSPNCALASGLGEAKDLEGRLTMILTQKLPKKLPAMARMVFLLAVPVLLAVYPTLAQRTGDADLATVTLEADDTPVGELLKDLADRTSYNFVIRPGVDLSQAVTVHLEDVSWEKALEAVLAESGLEVNIQGNMVWIHGGEDFGEPSGSFSGAPINMSLKNADLVETLRSFGEISAETSGVEITIQKGIAGSVTVEFRNVPWDQALDAILRISNLTSTLEGDVMKVHSPE